MPDRQISRRRERGQEDITCPVCDATISLVEQKWLLTEDTDTQVRDMDRTADIERDQATAASIILGKIATNDFDVFLAHNTRHKRQVERLTELLKQRGLNPWVDIEQIPPGRFHQDVIQQAIPKVKAAAVIIGPLDPVQMRQEDSCCFDFRYCLGK